MWAGRWGGPWAGEGDQQQAATSTESQPRDPPSKDTEMETEGDIGEGPKAGPPPYSPREEPQTQDTPMSPEEANNDDSGEGEWTVITPSQGKPTDQQAPRGEETEMRPQSTPHSEIHVTGQPSGTALFFL